MGRVALVTGGTRGIGRAISERLKKDGYDVAANYGGNEEAAKLCEQELGIKCYKFDVSDYDGVGAGLKQIESDLGPVDVVVNNAGVGSGGRLLTNRGQPLPEGYDDPSVVAPGEVVTGKR